MKFGIFYEMFVPPSEADAEARIIRETVDQIVHADKSGFDHVWLTEHHFLEGFSHMSAPRCSSVRPPIRPNTSGSGSVWR